MGNDQNRRCIYWQYISGTVLCDLIFTLKLFFLSYSIKEFIVFIQILAVKTKACVFLIIFSKSVNSLAHSLLRNILKCK